MVQLTHCGSDVLPQLYSLPPFSVPRVLTTVLLRHVPVAARALMGIHVLIVCRAPSVIFSQIISSSAE